MTRPVTLDDYKSVAKSLIIELEAGSPREYFIRSCGEFFATAPAPLPDLANMSPEQLWGHS